MAGTCQGTLDKEADVPMAACHAMESWVALNILCSGHKHLDSMVLSRQVGNLYVHFCLHKLKNSTVFPQPMLFAL